MPRFLFRNRWIALVWALGVLASIGVFFSDGGGQEDLAKAAETIRENAEFASSQQEPEATFVEEDEAAQETDEVVFAEEEEPATGTRRVMTAKMRLGTPRPGEGGAEDDEVETYVILDPQTAIPEGEDF